MLTTDLFSVAQVIMLRYMLNLFRQFVLDAECSASESGNRRRPWLKSTLQSRDLEADLIVRYISVHLCQPITADIVTFLVRCAWCSGRSLACDINDRERGWRT